MSPSSTVIPVAADLGLQFGMILAGVFISLILYGIGCLQMFIYFINYTADKVVVKSMVVSVFILSTVHIFLICIGIWEYLVTHWGDGTYLAAFHPPMNVSVIFNCLISTIVQSFFAWRVSILIKKIHLFLYILAPFIAVQPGAAIAYCVLVLKEEKLADISNKTLTLLPNLVNGTAAAVDVVIAGFMIILLQMGKTGFSRRTDAVFVRLTIITINTGLWTAIFAVLSVILLVTMPRTDIVYPVMTFPLGELYFNTLLATLNVRSFVRATRGNGLSQLSRSHVTDATELHFTQPSEEDTARRRYNTGVGLGMNKADSSRNDSHVGVQSRTSSDCPIGVKAE